MGQIQKGASRLTESSGILEMVWNVSFFLLMLSVICFGNTRSGTNYYYYAVFFLFIGVSYLEILLDRGWYRHLYLPLQTIWYGLFVILSIVSSIWAQSFATTILPISKMVQILLLTNCLIQHVRDERRLEQYIRVMMAASLFLIVYLLVRTPPSRWFSGFLGHGTGYNTNDIGLSIAVCVLLSFYEAYVRRRRICYVLTALSIFAVILTSSRKGILMSVFGIILIVVFNYRARRYMLRVLCILAAAVLLIFLIYQIPPLYRVVGMRIDAMLAYFMEDQAADYSISMRRYYIEIAKSILREHPAFGIGLNNFSYYVRAYGTKLTYCHNNYWEIAAGLGIVGLIVYYWFYAYLFLRLARQVLDGHKCALLFMALLLQFLVFEYGIVNYYKTQSQLVIAAAFCAVMINAHAEQRQKPKEQEDTE